MARSLARQLLTWLLPTSLALVAVGGVIAYEVAHHAASLAYDRALLDVARSVATQVRHVNGRIDLQLSLSTEQVLLYDNLDRVFYAVIGPNGTTIAGTAGLPVAPDLSRKVLTRYYDAEFSGQGVRAVSLVAAHEGISFTVVVIETLVKRDKLIREILLAMLLPEFLLVVMTILVMRYAIGHGLGGIGVVREELVKRSQADMRPIPLDTVPQELRPLIADTNDLLDRLSSTLERQRHLIADASHQLRTPIAALRAEAESALRSDDPRGALKRIATSARQLSKLAHNVLMLNRLESGPAQNPQQVELQDLISSAAERWLPHARERDIDLGFALQPAPTLGEPVWLEEMISNLVDNALRYTPLHGTVTVKCGQRQDTAWLSVEDSGPGIAQAERGRIFERFYRSRPEQGEGSGLGLAIVREVASNHRAQIDVGDSAELGGTHITVLFSRSKSEQLSPGCFRVPIQRGKSVVS
ncbi:MAG: sensor histidine kinase N-terminal domain-containing protein [Betaproteobacteria bacterium]